MSNHVKNDQTCNSMSTRSILVMEPCYPRYSSRWWMEPYNHRRALRKKLPFWEYFKPINYARSTGPDEAAEYAGKNRRITCEISLMYIIWTTIWMKCCFMFVAFEWIFQAHFGFFPHFRVDIWDCGQQFLGNYWAHNSNCLEVLLHINFAVGVTMRK